MTRRLAYAAAGLAAGVATKWVDDVANQVGGVIGPVLGRLGSQPGLWMLVVVTIAVLERASRREAAIRSAAFFLGMGLGYDAYSQLVLGFAGAGLVVFWSLAAVTVVPAATVLAVWADRVANDDRAPGRSQRQAWAVIGAFLSLPLAEALLALSLLAAGSIHPPAADLLSAGASLGIFVAIWLLMARTTAARRVTLVAGVLITPLAWLGLQLLFWLPVVLY